MATETATTRKLGPIGDKILFENEYVRIWSVKLDGHVDAVTEALIGGS